MRAVWWRHLAALAFLALLLPGVRLEPGLTALVPRGDGALAALAGFFADRAETRILALEAEGDGDLEGALTRLADDLGRRGLALPLTGSGEEILAVVNRVHQHLPALCDEALLAAIEPELAPEALRARLARLKADLAAAPDLGPALAAAYRDPLGLGGRVLAGLRTSAGPDPGAGPARHADGRHAALLLRVPFAPDDAARTRDLLAAVAAGTAPGVRISAVGAYRHFHDNAESVHAALVSSLPPSLVLIGLLLWSLLRRSRALLAAHLPVVFGLVAAAAISAAWWDHHVPLVLLGFASVLVGVLIDYGIHAVRACQEGALANLRRPLLIALTTSLTAFAVLAFSPVPLVAGMGVALIAGLLFAASAALHLVPAVCGDQRNPDRWQTFSRPLAQGGGRRWRLGLLLALSLAAVPGLLRLRPVSDVAAMDGSSPATLADESGFLARWGRIAGSDLLVGQGADADAALAALAEGRHRLGLPPSAVERLLPDRAEAQRRVAAWNDFWSRHADGFARDLATACAEAGVRVAAFAPGLDRLKPVTAPPAIDLAAWQGSAFHPLLAAAVRETPQGVQAAAPLGLDDPARIPALAARLDPPGGACWLASRRLLGERLFAAIGGELLRSGGLVLLAVAAALAIGLRSLRPVLSALAGPLLAVLWTFGLLGLLGQALTPFHVLVAAAVLGIGVDAAAFLIAAPDRARVVSPLLATTATTVIGVGSLAFSSHPVLSGLGLALAIGMTCCLAACLLVAPLARRES